MSRCVDYKINRGVLTTYRAPNNGVIKNVQPEKPVCSSQHGGILMRPDVPALHGSSHVELKVSRRAHEFLSGFLVQRIVRIRLGEQQR